MLPSLKATPLARCIVRAGRWQELALVPQGPAEEALLIATARRPCCQAFV